MVLLNNHPEVQSQGSPLVLIMPDIYVTIHSHINTVAEFIALCRRDLEGDLPLHRAIYLAQQVGFVDCTSKFTQINICLTKNNPIPGVSFTLTQADVKEIVDACIFIQNVFIDAGKSFQPASPGYQERSRFILSMVTHLEEVIKYVSGSKHK